MIGMVTLEIISPEPEKILQFLAERGFTLQDVRTKDMLSVEFSVSINTEKEICSLLSKKGCKITVKNRTGLYRMAAGMLRRPVLLIGLLFYIFCVIYVPSHIYFVRISGNTTVSDREILEAAQECGVSFGAKRRNVRSEKVKNALLQAIPELQWVGVNTTGCVAVISVKERMPTIKPEAKTPCSIVAVRDCVIRKISVVQGTPLCKVGDGVKAGQILVSGYKDYGIAQQLSYSEAEIFGETEHHLTVVAQDDANFRGEVTVRETKYSLILGKKQINFYKGSGILPASCVKMYERTYLTLPGGFVLPIAIVKQSITYYRTESKQAVDMSYLPVYAEEYLRSQMIAGTVLRKEEETESSEGVYTFIGAYNCLEIVGRIKNEELINKNG